MSRHNIEAAFEREEALVDNDYANGLIDAKERNRRLLELQRDARGEIEAEAWDAFEDAMGDRW